MTPFGSTTTFVIRGTLIVFLSMVPDNQDFDSIMVLVGLRNVLI